MKLFLAILIAALVAEISLAAAIQRPKRDADKKESSYQVVKEFTAYLMPRVDSIVIQLPDTPAYSTYKADLNEIVEYYKTENAERNCNEKYITLTALIKQLNEKLQQDKSEEAKKVLELLDGLEDDTVNNLMAKMKHAETPTIQETLEKC